jgi:hypothetical protein
MTLTASRAPSFVGCAPSYIRVIPDTLAALPTIDFDHLALPDGTTSHLCKLNARIRPTQHAANLAVVNWDASNAAGFCNGRDSYSSGHKAERWCFRGIHFKAVPRTISQTTANPAWAPVFATIGGDAAGIGALGPLPNLPNRIIYNQCYIQPNTDLYGTGGQGIFNSMDMEYFAYLNSWTDGVWEPSANTYFFFTSASSNGPYLFENNYIPVNVNWMITGGGPCFSYPANPSIAWRRNDLAQPWSWRPSEVYTIDAYGTNGWTFQVSNGGLTLAFVAGRTWWRAVQVYPQVGGYVYSPVDGTARQITATNLVDIGEGFFGVGSTLTLGAAWPLGDGGQFQGWLQAPAPVVLHQSGLTGALAHTTAGSRIVTLDTPLPAFTPDGITPIAGRPAVEYGPFFYTNDTVNRGETGSNVETVIGGRTIRSNNYDRGSVHGATGDGAPVPSSGAPFCRPVYPLSPGRPWQSGDTWDANSCRRRVEIVAISGDRLTLTLASPYFETIDFPYSIVCHDGLFRVWMYGGKGSFETKGGDRCLWEGNVIDGGAPTTMTPTGNDPMLYVVRVTITGSTGPNPQLTLTDPNEVVWTGATAAQVLAAFAEHARMYTTFGGMDPQLKRPTLPFCCVYLPASITESFVTVSRRIKSVDSATTATLFPLDPRMNGGDNIGDLVNTQVSMFFESNAHWVDSNYVVRYNVMIPPLGGVHIAGIWLSGSQAESQSEHDVGVNLSIHDNLIVDYDPSTPLGSRPDFFVLSNAVVDRLHPARAGIGSDWSDSYARISHNALVRSFGRGSHSFITANWLSLGVAHHVEIDGNIMDQYASLLGNQNEGLPGSAWIGHYEVPFRMGRNIAIKAGAAASMAANLAGFVPTNAGVETAAHVGFHDATATYPAILDPANYALEDVYATGTVSIPSNGLSATLASGTFPASVVPGQWFKTTTSPVRCQITSVAGNTITWTTPAHPEAFSSGNSYTIGFKGTASDGTDPGPNIPLLKLFTDGVRMLP